MAKLRYIFIPWKRDQGAEEALEAAKEWNLHSFTKQTQTVESWEDIDTTDKYTIVCWGDPAVSVTFDRTDQIYIQGGHCKPGGNVLKNRSGGYSLTADKVAERTIEQFSLTSAFNGVVKLYTCSSAVEGGLYGHTFGWFFTREFAKTCPNAIIYGYGGAVSKAHDFQPSTGGPNTKSVEVKGVLHRASELRFQVYP